MPPRKLPPAESLRTLESVANPDPQTSLTWGQSSPSIAVHLADISSIQLSSAVPEEIAIQFETARNLYLYAWHVYRFYMVAATQALTTLEFGLRERFPQRLPDPYQRKRQKQSMLAGMLAYAIDQGLVRNEGFSRWHRAAAHKARERSSMKVLETMIEVRFDDTSHDEPYSLFISPEDQSWDLVASLRDGLPNLRNTLAHGGPMLTRNVLHTIELVAEILGQLYPVAPQAN